MGYYDIVVEGPDSTPDGVGPHEFRELELMLRGEKPLASFCTYTQSNFELPDEDFDPYVREGTFVKREFIVHSSSEGPSDEVRYLYFALPEEEWRIDAAHQLVCEEIEKPGPESPEHSAALGRLLGYTDKEVTAFIAWVRKFGVESAE